MENLYWALPICFILFLIFLELKRISKAMKIVLGDELPPPSDTPEYYDAVEKKRYPNGVPDKAFEAKIYPFSIEENFTRETRRRVIDEFICRTELLENDKINFEIAIADATAKGKRLVAFPGGWWYKPLVDYCKANGYKIGHCGNVFDLWVTV